jgi:hypothetical protein
LILLFSIALGLFMRLLTGRGFAGLSDARLRGEAALLCLLVLQLLAPVLSLRGSAAKIAFAVWASTFPLTVVVAWLNRNRPGMYLVAVGLLLNAVVIFANGGMPVSSVAVSMVKQGPVARVPVGDFVHVAAHSRTILPWLSDVLPVPGPSWIRSVVSAGDCLLAAGIAVFLASDEPTRKPLHP